jgi:hypothetical protein
MPSDYPDPRAEWIQTNAVRTDPAISILHYGFLRRESAFFQKAREVQRIWVNNYDPRLEAAEKFSLTGKHWSDDPNVTPWTHNLVPYKGTHPKLIHQWLRERNHDPIGN